MRIEKFLPEMVMAQKIPTNKAEMALWNKEINNRLNRKLQDNFTIDLEWIKYNRVCILKMLKYLIVNFKIGNLNRLPDEFEAYNGIDRIAEMVLRDTPIFHNFLNLYNYFRTGEKKYYFHKEFFKELKSTNLDKITANDLYKGSGVIRLPMDLDDGYGGLFDEFVFFVGTPQEFYGIENQDDPAAKAMWEHILENNKKLSEDSIIWTLAWNAKDYTWYYTSLYTKEHNKLLKDLYRNTEMQLRTFEDLDCTKILEDGYQDHLKALFNCLVYLKSGEPDLRDFKNEIRYKNPNSRTPVKKDKDLCLDDITLVGYNYKKLPNYTKKYFYQPPYYARRGNAKLWKWCKGSFKTRKALD